MSGLPPPKPIMLKERSSMIFVEYGRLDIVFRGGAKVSFYPCTMYSYILIRFRRKINQP
jgi:hypothetical protein